MIAKVGLRRFELQVGVRESGSKFTGNHGSKVHMAKEGLRTVSESDLDHESCAAEVELDTGYTQFGLRESGRF
jgi:hypothetical protein